MCFITIRFKLVLLFLVLAFYTNQATRSQSLISIKGQILDSLTREPLPYASLGIKGMNLGTISNENGYFRFLIPDTLLDAQLNISYLGYRLYRNTPAVLRQKKAPILLQPAILSIREVQIHPLTAEDVVRLAVRNISKNYPEHSFISNGFYREMVKENDHYIQFTEAFVSTYNPSYADTSAIQAKIIQGRIGKDLEHLQFMYDESHKKYEKKKKRAERKGEKTDSTEPAALTVVFGGPEKALQNDIVKNKIYVLDTTKMKKFRYSFKNDNELNNHQLYTVYVESKGTIDHMKISGNIYIDKKSFAIVNAKLSMQIIIPIYLKPVLFTMGLSFKNVGYSREMQYREVNSKWYMQKMILNGQGDAEKKRIFKSNDRSHFTIQQAYVSTSVDFRNIKPFSPKDLINPDRPLSRQLGKYDPEFWKTHNKIDFKTSAN